MYYLSGMTRLDLIHIERERVQRKGFNLEEEKSYRYDNIYPNMQSIHEILKMVFISIFNNECCHLLKYSI